jgi:SAM-dependent methyltransferase
MAEEVIYHGRDLEAMAFAVNYHKWILKFFRPDLGKRIVEVGAGSGSFSELILERQVESLSLVEPSKTMYDLLCRYVGNFLGTTTLATYNSTFRDVAEQVKSAQQPDSVIYVNVLEHIEDDVGELKAVYQTLEQGGKVFIFVPALQWLYGRFDKQLGHFRRYTKPELEDKCRSAGFKILKSAYFDLFGVAPWWVKYRLLRSSTLGPRSVQLYDKYVVPCAKLLESAIRPPIGKNVILVAERS